MGRSTKCFSIEDEKPTCPGRGCDGRVGPPGAKRCAIVMLQGKLQGLIIKRLAIFRVRREGGRKKIAHWEWQMGKIKVFWFNEPVEGIGADCWQRGEDEPNM